MTLTATELTIHRLGTQKFIAANPTSIVLTPSGETLVAGTKTFVPQSPRAAQDFKVIWAYDNGIYRQLGDQGGVRRFDFIIVGNYDATVAINDIWQVGSQKFVITYIFPGNGYEVKAGGVSHGSSPG